MIFSLAMLRRWVVTGGHCLAEEGEYTVLTEINANGTFKNELQTAEKHIHSLYKPHTENNRPAYDIGLYFIFYQLFSILS